MDGWSCSELSRLKAVELLGGDGLWELELRGGNQSPEKGYTLAIRTRTTHNRRWNRCRNGKIVVIKVEIIGNNRRL